MIGNDIVDLALAKEESNWKRKGFLDKIFTPREQTCINFSATPEIMVWNLWSRKEAVYKIYNRETKIRAYIPLEIACYEQQNSGSFLYGKVICKNKTYFTKTKITNHAVHTVAVSNFNDFKRIQKVQESNKIIKLNGIPFVFDSKNKTFYPVSISHHGRFKSNIVLM